MPRDNMAASDSGIGMEGVGSAGSEDGYIGEFSRDYINAEIFKLFDTDGSGKITRSDLDDVAKQMGWDQNSSKWSLILSVL